MIKVDTLYPQYKVIQDRRKQETPVSPVAFERRTGIDRRSPDRVRMHSALTKDIFELKGSVNNIKQSQKIAEKIPFTSQILNMVKPNSKIDSSAANKVETAKVAALSGVFLGLIGALALGPIAGVASVAFGGYVGAKAYKAMVASHIEPK